MDQNIFELAKKLAALSPLESGAAIRLIREHGYKHGESASAVIDLAKALISVWDGKASTLDQASAWREVWQYLSDAGLVKESSGRSRLGQVLDILGDYRRMSAGAEPLALPEEPVSGDFDKNMLEIKKSCSEVMKEACKAFTHSESSALIEKLASAMFNMALSAQQAHREVVAFMKPVCVINTEGLVNTEWLTNEVLPGTILGIIRANKRLAGEESPSPAIREVIGKASVSVDGVNLTTDDREWEGQEFGKGCTVYLKSGGPKMTVIDIQDTSSGEYLFCEWETPVGSNREWFRKTSLSRTPFEAPANENYPPELYGEPMSSALKTLATVVEPARLDVVRRLLVLQDTCYGLAERAGWWTDLETGEDVRSWEPKHFNNWISAKLMLIVTEVAEAMEGHRKGLKDTHLKHRGMLEVELADAVIRIMDLAGGLNMDVAGAIVEKLAYNMSREDHQIENRKAEGGKSV